jgi:hypothetical protein
VGKRNQGLVGKESVNVILPNMANDWDAIFHHKIPAKLRYHSPRKYPDESIWNRTCPSASPKPSPKRFHCEYDPTRMEVTPKATLFRDAFLDLD